MANMYYRSKASQNELNPQGFFSYETYLQMIVNALEMIVAHALKYNGQLIKSGVLPPVDNPGDEASPLYFVAKKHATDQLYIYIFTEEEYDERR